MDIKKYKEMIELIIFISAAVFPAVGLPVTDGTKAIIVGVVVIVFILFKAGQLAHRRFLEERSMSKVKTMSMASRYAKTIKKFTDVVDKKISKNKNFDRLYRLQETKNKVLYELKDPDKVTKKRLKLEENLTKINYKIKDKEIIELINKTEEDKYYLIAHKISKLLVDFERTLLHAEQYNYRIKFGEFISKYALNENDRQRALIDSIGWTYFMTGRIEKGEKAIFAGINRALNVVNESQNEKVKQESIFNLARAYRHLGSNRYTGENYPEKALEYLSKAEEYITQVEKEKLTTDKESIEKIERRILEMNIGIDYGKIIAYYHQFNLKLKKQILSETDYENFYNAYKLLKGIKGKTYEFSNKHRYVKVEVLITKFLEVFHDHYEQFTHLFGEGFISSKYELIKEFNRSLVEADNVFKENIFTDEAIESYLEQKVIEMKYNILQILKGVK